MTTATAEPQSTTSSTIDVRSLYREVSSGLRRNPKRIPEKLFYDEKGAQLFEDITRTEAYYPTRAELEILETYLPRISRLVGPRARVVEFGSGEGLKTAMLLGMLDAPATCIPIDLAESQLRTSCERLRTRHPGMEVIPLAADYTVPFELPVPSEEPAGETLFFFPGSSIGNFEPHVAANFLRRVGGIGGSGSKLLVGVDLVKPAGILEAAYDDPEGVTADFNLNALTHVNRLLNADFDEDGFRHRAVWNERRWRIEMRLVSLESQQVTLAPELPGVEPVTVSFPEGDELVTEHSYKYLLPQFECLCLATGWRTLDTWTDRNGWFSVHLLEWEGAS